MLGFLSLDSRCRSMMSCFSKTDRPPPHHRGEGVEGEHDGKQVDQPRHKRGGVGGERGGRRAMSIYP